MKDGTYTPEKAGKMNDRGGIFYTSKPEKTELKKPKNKYHRDLKGVTVDVYDVLKAFEVTDPALQHLIKKALCAGLRGHKNKEQDLQDILDSAMRAVELNKRNEKEN